MILTDLPPDVLTQLVLQILSTSGATDAHSFVSVSSEARGYTDNLFWFNAAQGEFSGGTGEWPLRFKWSFLRSYDNKVP